MRPVRRRRKAGLFSCPWHHEESSFKFRGFTEIRPSLGSRRREAYDSLTRLLKRCVSNSRTSEITRLPIEEETGKPAALHLSSLQKTLKLTISSSPPPYSSAHPTTPPPLHLPTTHPLNLAHHRAVHRTSRSLHCRTLALCALHARDPSLADTVSPSHLSLTQTHVPSSVPKSPAYPASAWSSSSDPPSMALARARCRTLTLDYIRSAHGSRLGREIDYAGGGGATAAGKSRDLHVRAGGKRGAG
ncbi:hypothetical protein IQ07DRAFT_603579 [Pyrenochaeta sp. DS3sAY3a]|nr:hypothetical protein IQ07DRAFT_603579 [Pyrenochaeta sp. DS3sAY3a]